jgi:hypothetical protein
VGWGRPPLLGWPLLFELGLRVAPPVALAFDGDDLRVVRQAIDERDGAARVGKHAVPVLEGQVRGQHTNVPHSALDAAHVAAVY